MHVKKGISALLLIALVAPRAHAVGGWLELTPTGGVEIDEEAGDSRG